jgi:hypothetical protein
MKKKKRERGREFAQTGNYTFGYTLVDVYKKV